MCCVLLVHGRCVKYAGGYALCDLDAGWYASCTALCDGGGGGWALFARGVGSTEGAGGDALCAALYTGGGGGWTLFAGGVGDVGGVGGAGGDALYATLLAGD